MKGSLDMPTENTDQVVASDTWSALDRTTTERDLAIGENLELKAKIVELETQLAWYERNDEQKAEYIAWVARQRDNARNGFTQYD